MSKNLPSLLLAPLLGAATIATFSACGDEVTEVNETTQVTQVTGMLVVKKGEALPECGAENEGTMAYSMDSAAAYYCIDEEWTSLQGKDGKDGKDGEDGKDGKDGKDGEDGTDGEDGKDGSDATSCKMTEDDYGYITMTCGENSFESKNLRCEGERYNQDTHFCFKNQLYQKCGKSIFYPDSQFCRDNQLYEICNGQEFKISTHFCADTQVLELCYKSTYDPKTQYCSNNQVFEKNAICGGVGYDSTEWFCDYRDSSLYRYVIMPGESGDSVIWMAENLNLVIEKSLFGRSDSTTEKYLGRVYYADSPLDSLCPQGWHLPDSTEYATLLSLRVAKTCARYLKAVPKIWSRADDMYLFSLYPTYSREDIPKDYGIDNLLQYTAALWTSSTRDGNPLLVVIGEDFVSSTENCIGFISSDDLIDGDFNIPYANVRCVKDK